MESATPVRVEEVLNSFAEVMSALMIDQYQKHIAELDLTLPQAQVLRILRRAPVPTGQLACELKISAPAITQLTDRLIRKGLIERSAKADDRRCVIVALSERGRQLVDEFRQRRQEVFSRALRHLSQEEQTQIIEALLKVVTALESFESQGKLESSSLKANSIGKKQKKPQVITGEALQ
ncbi:MAG: MarR family transcriptional regulator [Pyrinomonadaceae bacterium]|nr:MarR family transcriptional regulator [Pyrinomonadaceae bacterium]